MLIYMAASLYVDDARGKDISRFAAISWCPFYKLFVCNNLMLEAIILSVHNTAGLCWIVISRSNNITLPSVPSVSVVDLIRIPFLLPHFFFRQAVDALAFHRGHKTHVVGYAGRLAEIA